jgi:hypothetical protein
MVTSLSSPGVEVREIDLTGIVPSVSTTEGVIAGVFHWGPVDERVLIEQEKQLVARFEKPSNFNAETFFTAASFLAYGNKLYVTRVANTAGRSPTANVVVETGNNTLLLGTGDTSNLEVGMVSISTANDGLTIGATIASIVNTTAVTISNASDATANSTESVQWQSDTSFSAVGNTGPVANLEYHTIANSFIFDSRDGTYDTDVQWVAKYPGEVGNSLRVSVCGNSAGFESTINLASYGARASLVVNTNANTANVFISAAAIADANANTAVLKALINDRDLIEVGNNLIGFQYLKVISLGTTLDYGTVSNTYALTTISGNTLVLANNTTDLAAGMLITSSNTGLLDLVVNNVVNATAFYTTVAPSVTLNANDATIWPTCSFQFNFEDKYSLSTDYKFSSANTSTRNVPRKWEFFNLIAEAPGQSDYVINFGNSSINGDEVHIVVVDADGKFTGVPGSVLETYRGLSRGTDAKTLDGGANYYKSVINDNSQYVWSTNDMSGAPSANVENLANSTLDVLVYDLAFGKNGKDESNIELSAITGGYDLYNSPEDVDISIVLQGKARSFALANYIIDNIVYKRKDCVATISPQRGDVVNNTYNERDAIVAFRNNLRASYDGSYALLDSGYKYMYDRYNDIYRWVPLNGDTAGLMVRTDRTNAPWYPPAGYNRGAIKNVIKLAFNPRQADRDVLYRAGVNPVVTFPGQGTLLYGDKTLLAKPSAFDRINVRRLFIVLEKAISKAAKYTLFEFNDEFTRLQFKNLIVPYLRDVQGRRGITDFEVVCDETNNTPEVIDRNEFVGDIYIKPARSINFITLNFVAVRTGVEFNEVIGKF